MELKSVLMGCFSILILGLCGNTLRANAQESQIKQAAKQQLTQISHPNYDPLKEHSITIIEIAANGLLAEYGQELLASHRNQQVGILPHGGSIRQELV